MIKRIFLLVPALIIGISFAYAEETAEECFSRANTYAKNGEFNQAIAEFDKVTAMRPNDPAVYYNRGHTYFEKGEYVKAIDDFTKSISIKPFADAYYARGVTYWKANNPELSIADYTSAIAMNPNFANAYCNRGVVYAENNKPEEAIADFNKTLEINPNDALAYAGRSKCYYLLGKIDSALEDADKARSLGYALNLSYLGKLKKAAEAGPEIPYSEFTINEMGRVFQFKGRTNCSKQLIRDMLPGITGVADGEAKEFLIKTDFVKWGDGGKYWEENWVVETKNKTANFLLTLTPTPDGGADYQIQQK